MVTSQTNMFMASSVALQIGLQVCLAVGAISGVAAQSSLPDELSSLILNFVTFIRALEQCCGVVVGTTLFENRFNSLVQAHLESGSLPLPFVISGRYAGYALVEIRNLPFIIVDIHQSIYSDSVKPVWYTGMELDAIASASCFYVRRASLDPGYTTNQRFTQ
jgi:hypothetical protein